MACVYQLYVRLHKALACDSSSVVYLLSIHGHSVDVVVQEGIKDSVKGQSSWQQDLTPTKGRLH